MKVWLKAYPKAVAKRSGCKVGWLYYRTQDEANKASRLAEKQGIDKARRGYDFGFQMPGNVRYVESGEFAKLWEVTIP